MPNSLYKVTPGQAQPPLASDVNQYADALNGNVDIGQITLAAPISAPITTGITGVAATGTSLGVGAYRYQFTYVVGIKKSDNTVVLGAETLPSTAVAVTTTTGNQAVNLSGLPTSWPSTAVALRIYRTAVGGADGTQKLVATITTAVSSYADTTVDGALGAAVPTTNTTGTDIVGFTADPTQAPDGLTGTLKQFISWITNRIKAITGTTNWYDAPRTTLENAVKLNGDTMTGLLTASDVTITGVAKISGSYPTLRVVETDGTTGSQEVRIANDQGKLWFQVFNETNSAWVRDLASFDRATSAATFPDDVTVNGALKTRNALGSIYVGDDAIIEDFNSANAIRVKGQQDATTADIYLGTNGYKVWSTKELRDNAGVLEFYTSGAWKPVGGIKNVQRGTSTISGTTTTNITISAVNMSKSFVNISFSGRSVSGNYYSPSTVTAEITSTTNLQLIPLPVYGPDSTTVKWEVIESY